MQIGIAQPPKYGPMTLIIDFYDWFFVQRKSTTNGGASTIEATAYSWASQTITNIPNRACTAERLDLPFPAASQGQCRSIQGLFGVVGKYQHSATATYFWLVGDEISNQSIEIAANSTTPELTTGIATPASLSPASRKSVKQHAAPPLLQQPGCCCMNANCGSPLWRCTPPVRVEIVSYMTLYRFVRCVCNRTF